nr:hypothetical protein [Crucivirus sp.]
MSSTLITRGGSGNTSRPPLYPRDQRRTRRTIPLFFDHLHGGRCYVARWVRICDADFPCGVGGWVSLGGRHVRDAAVNRFAILRLTRNVRPVTQGPPPRASCGHQRNLEKGIYAIYASLRSAGPISHLGG